MEDSKYTHNDCLGNDNGSVVRAFSNKCFVPKKTDLRGQDESVKGIYDEGIDQSYRSITKLPSERKANPHGIKCTLCALDGCCTTRRTACSL